MTSLQEQLAALHTNTAAASTSAEATTATKLRTLMASIAGVTTEDIADNSLLIDDLGFQSLDLIQLAVRCEQTFGVKTNAEAYLAMRTFADVLRFCEQSTN